MQVKFKKLDSNAKLPVKAHPTDACYDVWATRMEVTQDYVVYYLGFAVEIPPGWEMKFYPRSSNSKKDLLLANSVATIDAPFRGEIQLRFKPQFPADVVMNMGNPELDKVMMEKYKNWKPKMYDTNEAVAQLSIQPVYEIEWEEVDELTNSDRGTGGFGSSNKRQPINPEIKEGDGS